jgi:hypothetical protein
MWRRLVNVNEKRADAAFTVGIARHSYSYHRQREDRESMIFKRRAFLLILATAILVLFMRLSTSIDEIPEETLTLMLNPPTTPTH